jgi:hydrogenase maturation protease
MSSELVEKIANAVLYEGYLLYPYRPSSVKNQRRFTFGVLVPPAYSDAQSGTETASMRTECLVRGGPATSLDVRVRFLQVIESRASQDGQDEVPWQDSVERDVRLTDCLLGDLLARPRCAEFCFPAPRNFIQGAVELTAEHLEEGLFQVAAHVTNWTPLDHAEQLSRDEVLPHSFAATHTILVAREGQFVSLLDPPDPWRPAAARCRNAGTWPVLVGEHGERSTMLSSPIILYDYPQVAAESPGDLFDATEIDEILTLRILTLTEDEKSEMRGSGEQARRILERTETLPAEQLMKLHGALRGLRPVQENK